MRPAKGAHRDRDTPSHPHASATVRISISSNARRKSCSQAFARGGRRRRRGGRQRTTAARIRQTFALHDAQLVIARALRIRELAEAQSVRGRRHGQAADRRRSRAQPRRRPRDAAMCARSWPGCRRITCRCSITPSSWRAPEMVRILMAHGANAREGVYPHRDATTAHAIAAERKYDRDRRHHRGRGTEVAGRAERRGRGAACRRPVPRDRIRRLPPCHNDAGRQPGAGSDATRSL